MKKIIVWMAGSMLMLGFLSSTSYAETHFKPYRQQQKSIYQGKAGRLLAPWELRFLSKKQQKVRRAYRLALQDGRITPMERRRIRMLQAKAFRHPSWWKKNDQKRAFGSPSDQNGRRGKAADQNIHGGAGPSHHERMPFGSARRSW